MDRYKWILYSLLVLFGAAMCFHPPYPEQLPLQHIPTMIILLALVWSKRLRSLSRLGFTLIVVYTALHVVGARYLYSYVPYDDWSRALFHFSISEALQTTRNHYDRLVHFSFGLLIVYPLRELLLRYTKASETFVNYVAVECILATSMLYELFEWFIAIVLSPENAEAYNGQQGDPWDSQKDMAWAALGAVIAITVILVRRHKSRKTAMPIT